MAVNPHMKTVAVCCPLLVVLALTGCNDELPRAEVSGKVIYQGQPVRGGVIYFLPDRGPQASSALDEDGAYRLTTPGHGSGAVLGRHTIYFQPLYEVAPLATYTNEDAIEGKMPPELKSQLLPALPERFFSPEQSGLKAEVKADATEMDWSLKM